MKNEPANTTEDFAPQDWPEGRRLRAWQLCQQGWYQADIARALGVTPGAVCQWIKRATKPGVEALRTREPPGPAPRLSVKQRAQIPGLLSRGAESFGFRGDVWTTERIARVIEREFGVRYHPDHVSRLLKQTGWSPQKPEKRATQRDEQAINAWFEERWPEIKKKPAGKTGSSST